MTISETTDDSFRLSTAECFQLPEVLFALKNLKSECRMLSEREVDNCDFNEMGMYISFRNNIWFIIVLSLCWTPWYPVCLYTHTDCTGVPFAKELCVNCKSKSCPENVTCYVLAGKCSRWYYSKKYVTEICGSRGTNQIWSHWHCSFEDIKLLIVLLILLCICMLFRN